MQKGLERAPIVQRGLQKRNSGCRRETGHLGMTCQITSSCPLLPRETCSQYVQMLCKEKEKGESASSCSSFCLGFWRGDLPLMMMEAPVKLASSIWPDRHGCAALRSRTAHSRGTVESFDAGSLWLALLCVTRRVLGWKFRMF